MHLPNLFRRFCGFPQDRSGNFLILFSFSAVLLFLGAGMAVDYSMALNKRARLGNALDAATLATARALYAGEIRKSGAKRYLRRVFAANLGLKKLRQSGYIIENVDVDTRKQVVTASASYRQRLRFIPVATGKTTQKVARLAAANYSGGDIEVAIVMDVSLSMDGQEISDLKAAAKTVVGDLLRSDGVRISLVPYTRAVNVGDFLSRYVFYDDPEPRTNTPFFKKTLFRRTGRGFTKREAKGKPCCRDGRIVKNTLSPPDTCATGRKRRLRGRSHLYTDANPAVGGMISRDDRLPPRDCLSPKIVPLTDKKDVLVSSIASYRTSYGTSTHVGLQWGWYLISRKWRGYLPARSKPRNHRNPRNNLKKYVILMSDGITRNSYAETEGRKYENLPESAMLLRGYCNAVKRDDIKIFAIAYHMKDDRARRLMKDCASPDEPPIKYFYDVYGGRDQLTQAFKNIAGSMQTLRLTR